jgi:Mg-chelatase subunit ChlD
MSRRRLLLGLLALACSLGAGFAAWSLLGAHPATLSVAGHPLELEAPRMLALLASLPLLAWAAAASLADLPPLQRALSLLARVGILTLLTLALAQLSSVRDATRVAAVMLVDVSDSVTDPDLEAAAALVQEARQVRGDGTLHVVTFANEPRVVPLPDEPETTVALQRHERGDATDLQAAIQLAYGLLPVDHVRRIAVLSDGRQTRGDLLREAERARRFGVRLSTRALAEGSPAEVAVTHLSLPDDIDVGESFEVRAHLHATRPTRARLRLYQGPVLNGLDGVREVDLKPGDNEAVFRSVVRTAGEVAYRLELTPEGADRFDENNRASATAVVPGRPSVLIVEADPSHARHLARALSVEDYEVEVRPASAIPRSLGEIARYDFVVLSDVPAERVLGEPMRVIERYVRDLGGGFMMAGGERSFGLGGYRGTPMESLLPVRMDSERRRDEHSLALALVIDTSGSMSGIKMELAKDAAKAAAELLAPEDSIAVIGFSGDPERKVRMQTARNRARILRDIGKLRAQGGTAIFPALDMAFTDLLSTRARIKHVILLTDGQTQERGIPELVQAMGAESISVSTVGLGNDVNRSLLQEAANLGHGRAYFTSDPHNVPRIFMRETTTVGRSSAVEELIAAVPTAPADFLRGIDMGRAPYLRGYVATQAKPAPAQVVLRSELGEPLLARWRVGLGWALAWTSDIKNRWALDWIRWSQFPRFWGQLVREHMKRQRHDSLPMSARVVRGELRVQVDALGPDDRFINGLDSELTLDGPLGSPERERQTVQLRQRAPGLYAARLPLRRNGTFALNAVHRRDDRIVARSHGQVSYPYPAEYAAGEPDLELLARAARTTGGAPLRDVRKIFDPGEERVLSRHPRWPELLLWALLLFILDLALRRVQPGGPGRDSVVRPAAPAKGERSL